MSTSGDVIKQVIKLFEGLPNWGHPLTMCNVTPQGNTAAIVAAILTEIFAPNILEGEYAWNIHQAELESGGILANLAGWEPKKSGCVYTYGGSGCWTYHLKYALTRVLPELKNAEAKPLTNEELKMVIRELYFEKAQRIIKQDGKFKFEGKWYHLSENFAGRVIDLNSL